MYAWPKMSAGNHISPIPILWSGHRDPLIAWGLRVIGCLATKVASEATKRSPVATPPSGVEWKKEMHRGMGGSMLIPSLPRRPRAERTGNSPLVSGVSSRIFKTTPRVSLTRGQWQSNPWFLQWDKDEGWPRKCDYIL